MSILVYDEIAFREPNLLVPGKMPVGAVKLNKDFAYANRTSSCLLPGNGIHDHGVLSPTWEVVGTYKSKSGGMHFDGSTRIYTPDLPLLTNPTGETYVVQFRPNASGVRMGVFETNESGVSPSNVYDRGFVRESTNYLEPRWWNGPFDKAGSTQVVSGDLVTVCVVLNKADDNLFMYVNGRLDLDDAAYTHNGYDGYPSSDTLVGSAQESTPTYYFGGEIFLFSRIDTNVSKAAARSLSVDPYQLVSPV